MKYLKYIPWMLIILALIATSFYQWRAAVAAKELAAVKNEQLMKANLEIGRANTKLLEQNKLNKIALEKINKAWKDEIKKRQALVTLYAELQAKYEAEKKNKKVITKIIYKTDPNTSINFPPGKIFTKDKDGNYIEVTSMQWSYNDFRITLQGDAVKQTISYKLHQHFYGKLIESKLPTGGYNHYLELYELDDQGKQVGKLQLEKFEVLRAEALTATMNWWNPKIDLGIGAGVNTQMKFALNTDIGFSFFSFGKTDDDIKWRFLRIGTGIVNQHFSLTLTPALYNIGKNLPLVSNIWLAPYAGYDFTQKNAHFGLGLSVVF